MDAKLTLKLDKHVIDNAKKYASAHKKSLSRIIESYLRSVTENESFHSEDVMEISPFVKSMQSGVQIPPDLDEQKVYREYLKGKYK